MEEGKVDLNVQFSTSSYLKCKEDILSFRNANRETRRDEVYFDWRYLGRPIKLEPIIVWAHNRKGKAVGALSLIPHSYSVYDREYPIGLLGDISVAKEWRGKGVAKGMYRFLSGLNEVKRLKGCIVIPNEEAARSLEKSGWFYITHIERYVKIMNIEPKIGRWIKTWWIRRVISCPINVLLRAFPLSIQFRKATRYHGVILEKLDERFDTLWNSMNKGNVIIGLRNKAYLTWRYLNHPNVRYKIFILEDTYGALFGYLIFHQEEKIIHIDDLLCRQGSKYPVYLLVHFFKYIRAYRDINTITLHISNNDFCKIPYRRLGFMRRPDYQKVMALFNRNNEDIFLRNKTKWYLTAGDKDV